MNQRKRAVPVASAFGYLFMAINFRIIHAFWKLNENQYWSVCKWQGI